MEDLTQVIINEELDIPFKEFSAGQVIQSKQFNEDMRDIEDKVNEVITKHNFVSNNYDAHSKNLENPHQVTAHQTGAYTSGEIDAFVSDLKAGNLDEKAITNRVIADETIDSRTIKNSSLTVSKVDTSFGSQLDISKNTEILDRYTKQETDALVQSKVGDGTYDKVTIDEKFSQVQAGVIVDKSLGVEKLKDSVGTLIEISENPQITGRYTKAEVNTLIKSNCVPKDLGKITEEVDNDDFIELPDVPQTIYNVGVLDYSKVGKSVVASGESRMVEGRFVEGELITSVDLNTLVDDINDNTSNIETLNTTLTNVKNTLPNYQAKVDNTLTTTSKNVVGAVNELKTKSDTHTSQISSLISKDSAQDGRISTLESANAHSRLSALENINAGTRLSNIEAKNTEQDKVLANHLSSINTLSSNQDVIKDTVISQGASINSLKAKDTEHDGKLSSIESTNTTQDNRLTAVETFNTTQNTRLDKVEATNATHGTRLDKVEYQNKVQDTYIQGLFNENGDKRLNIEGGGNDLKLEGSTEGLAQVDNIVGNTSVNYCISGSRELTLNGDIEASGTFVTTTEGVDGGLVDVVCEGNTLVNLCPRLGSTNWEARPTHNGNVTSDTVILNKVGDNQNTDVRTTVKTSFKPSSDYTIIFTVKNNVNCIGFNINAYDGSLFTTNNIPLDINQKGLYKIKKTTLSSFVNTNSTTQLQFYGCVSIDSDASVEITNMMILEGDYTNKPIPTQYFEGIKSVGQDDTNGHKIELTSTNKNLFDISKLKFRGTNQGSITDNKVTLNPTGAYTSACTYEEKWKHKTNCSYTMKADIDNTLSYFEIKLFDSDGNKIGDDIRSYGIKNTFLIPDNTDVIRYTISNGHYTGDTVTITNVQLEENTVSTPYTPHASNTLTIPLSEPLRGFPNGVKDRFVKKDGKWYVERNCGKVVLNGSEGWLLAGRQFDNCMNVYMSSINKDSNKIGGYFLADRLAYSRLAYGLKYDIECITSNIGQGDTLLIFQINKSKLPTQDIPGFKTWLSQNPTTVIYELATPIYEPLDVTPELQTYLETTHISNNSIIPCNMVIRNTGFNSIIKPSTLYTVIADTSGIGTLGVNLGGTKLTTSSNKLTITTPATLTENMLRPYGKGLKGSKFRLLEGDNMALSYPYFEGLKSTFEGQLVTQEMITAGTEKAENLGKYKVMTKVRGKNIFSGVNNLIYIKDKKKLALSTIPNGARVRFKIYDSNKNLIKHNLTVNSLVDTYIKKITGNGFYVSTSDVYTLNADSVGNTIETFENVGNVAYIQIVDISTGLNYNILQLEEGTVATPYEPYYERTQTVYLTSPLLKGDEIVAKEDRLYHYHKMGKVVLDGSENWLLNDETLSNTNRFVVLNLLPNKVKDNAYGISSNIPYTQTSYAKDVRGLFLTNPSGNVYCRVNKISLNEFKAWLQANPTTVVYELAEPYYEKIADYPITLDIIPTSTLSVDSLIPCTTLKASYTGSVPSVYKLEETSTQNSEYIQDTQIAVDFLLMNAMSSVSLAIQNTGLTEKGVNTMGAYFASRIMRGYLSYAEVIAKYPQFKDDIDFILKSEGREDLITV